MSTFQYNALTSAGRLMKGTIEAGSREDATEQLREMTLAVNSVQEAEPEKPKTAIGRSEFMLFNQQLASITKAGIPLERGLRELANDIGSKSMRRLIDEIAGELEAGTSIEEAFEKRQKRFPALYGRILKAGVETGRLSEMLTSLNRHLTLANNTRRIIFEAMVYPGIILVLAAIILTFVFLLIIPQFEIVYAEMTDGASLPALTRFFFGISRNIIPFWAGVGMLAAAVVTVFASLSTVPAGRRFKESLFLRIPVVGRVYHSGVLSRMAEAMSMMVAAGCDMPACLRLGTSATDSEKLVFEAETLAGQIERGANILEAGQFCRMIPRLFLYSIQLGTQRNELQDNLQSLGRMYAEHAQHGQARLQATLLPTMLIGVGGIVALCVVAMFMPMIRIVTLLSM